MPDSIDLRQFARLLNVWSKARSHGLRGNGRGGEMLDRIQLHWRPDPRGPEAHVTLEAMMIDGRAAIRLTTSELVSDSEKPGTRAVVPLGVRSARGEHSLGRDPDAICEACGAIGTIGRAMRTNGTGDATETHRFCRACWPEQSARYRARWEEEDRLRRDRFLRGLEPPGAGPGAEFESATWHTTLEMVSDIERALRESVNLSPRDLDDLADEIRRIAPRIDDPMPFEVEYFLSRFGTDTR